MTNVNKTTNDKISIFNSLLDSLKLTDKKKELWKDIFAHAMQDRDYALQMYTSVSNLVVADPTAHAIHGPNIAKYLERMSRSNDQLLKLAELVALAENVDDESGHMSVEEIYEKLGTTDSVPKKKIFGIKK